MATALLVACLDLGAQQAPSWEKPHGGPRENHQDSPIVSVGLCHGLLSVQARQGSWMKVLNEVTHETGILFHPRTSLEGSVNLSFKDLPLKQALERLFGPQANFVVRYAEGAEVSESFSLPKEVWILGGVEKQGLKIPAPSAAKVEAEQAPLSAIADQSTAAKAAALTDEEQIDKLLEQTNDENPHIRLQALLALSENGKAGESTIQPALDIALADKDPGVRGYAVQALARRGGPETIPYLQQALRDPDPNVRTMAVDSVVPKEHGIALLQEALLDVDETVRSLAMSRLKHESQQKDSK